ncbi:MAG: helix-turn-helix domain-containing protein [Candidatus Methanomethylophilaceae archaeon]|jgi:tetratricopeptide (TPR) repeat protein
MTKTTIRERILLHLSRFIMVSDQENYNLPFDLTQDGIASALGISRAHSSLELKKLRRTGLVKERQVRVIGSNVRRKVYHLEEEGLREAEMVKKRLEAAGIPFETILDLKHCEPELMWAKLNDSDRDVLGLACVIRIPVHKDALPPASSGVIPATHKGMVDISNEVKMRYLGAADPELVRKWNSLAADWYIDNNSDNREKLYHLIKSGRNFESDRLLIRDAGKFLVDCDEELMSIIKTMDHPEKTPKSSWSIRGKLAINCRDVEYAETCAERLREMDSSEGDILSAEIKYVRGDYEGALEDAETLYAETKSARIAMLRGRSLYALEEYDRADRVLVGTLEEFSAIGDISRVDELLVLRAGIAHKRNDTEMVISLLNKALYSAIGNEKKEKIMNLIETVESGESEPVFD